MRKAIPLIAFLLTLMGLIAYVITAKPEVVQQLLIKVDVFGITETGRNEKDRQYKINNLNITWEEKQVLLNKTVFMGAMVDMVKLALGDPKRTIQKEVSGRGTATYFVYYLPNDKRPTILVFLNGELVQAYKGSALDFIQ